MRLYLVLFLVALLLGIVHSDDAKSAAEKIKGKLSSAMVRARV